MTKYQIERRPNGWYSVERVIPPANSRSLPWESSTGPYGTREAAVAGLCRVLASRPKRRPTNSEE